MRKPGSETAGLLHLVDTNSFFVDTRAPSCGSRHLMQAEADSWLDDSAKENRDLDASLLDEKQIDLDVNLGLCSSSREVGTAEGNWSLPKVATEEKPILEMLEAEEDELPYDPISAPWSPRPRYMRLKRNLGPAVVEKEEVPPYDPELNPLSPRPRFRKYNPHKRLELLQVEAGLEQEYVEGIFEADVGEQIFDGVELRSGSVQELLDEQVNFCTSGEVVDGAHLVQEAATEGIFADARIEALDEAAEEKAIAPRKSRWSRLLKMLVAAAISAFILWLAMQDPSLWRNSEQRILTPKWDWTQENDDQLSSLARNYLTFSMNCDKEESPPAQPSAATVAEVMDDQLLGSCFWSDWEESKREMCLNRTAMATARTAKAPAAEQDILWVVPHTSTPDEEMQFPTPVQLPTPVEEMEFLTPDEEMQFKSIEPFEGVNDASPSLHTEAEPEPRLTGRAPTMLLRTQQSIRFQRLLSSIQQSAVCGYISAVLLASFLLSVFSWLIVRIRKAARTEKMKESAVELQAPQLTTATNLASDSTSASFASEDSLSPAVSGSSDYGSFTAFEPLVLNRGEVKLTPVRRSSRLRSRTSQAPCLRA